MKNSISLLFAMLLSVMAFAQKPAVFTGKIIGFDASKTHLQTMDASHLMDAPKPLACNADGTFRLELNLTKPTRYYIVMDEPHTGFLFYAEPGMKANMTVKYRTVTEADGDRVVCDVEYKGANKDCFDFVQKHNFYDAQNEVLNKYYGQKGVTFKTFRDSLRAAVSKHEALFAKVGTKAFRNYMHDDYENKYNQALGWYTEINDGTPDADYDAYMASTPYQTDEMAASSYASYYQKFKTPKDSDATLYLLQNINNVYPDKNIAKSIATQVIQARMALAPDNIDALYQTYISNIGEDAAVKAVYEQNKSNVSGKEGIDFTMQDINGNKIKFSELKGKAVYFDMWATWCGPCKAEIPFMAKLAKHYQGSDKIQIISVSLDENINAWKKMITKDHPDWPQYIIPENFNSELCKQYSINGIPRFMMFDKDGKVISIDAPRPSSPDIISWIDGNLK